MGLADALIASVSANTANLVARKQFKFKEYTSSGTFVIGTGGDATTTSAVFNIVIVGGGGGGGLGSVTTGGAGTVFAITGGGGGGGEVRPYTTTGFSLLGTATSGTITVTIGAGGAAGNSANGGTAAVGGDSSFGTVIARGGGSGDSNIETGAAATTVLGKARATEGGVGVADRRAVAGITQTLSAACGAGGGRRFDPYVTTATQITNHYFNGPQNGKNAGASDQNRNPDYYQATSNVDMDAATILSRPSGCGFNGAGVSNNTNVGGFWGKGGEGLFGFGGGASGALASWGGTTIALAVVTPPTWVVGLSGTAYNIPEYYAVDGGGRGAVVTGLATANSIAATSGSPNTGGGGGAGAACATATTYYNALSAGGSGASGYCFVYWWE